MLRMCVHNINSTNCTRLAAGPLEISFLLQTKRSAALPCQARIAWADRPVSERGATIIRLSNPLSPAWGFPGWSALAGLPSQQVVPGLSNLPQHALMQDYNGIHLKGIVYK